MGQDDGSDSERTLDGRVVRAINPDLTSGVDLTSARRLPENAGTAFYADIKGGPFEVTRQQADEMIGRPNPDGRSSRDVVRPWINALDITERHRDMWIVDFGVDMPLAEAALYEAPFEYVREHVLPFRRTVRRATYRERWWLHEEPISGMRAALTGLGRYFVTPMTAKHRLFAWVTPDTLASSAVVVFARDDDYTFGVLHSRVHELWALAVGTQLETRPRYTVTTCFETFPFPHSTDDQREAIAAAARRLVSLRDGWLNPPGLVGPELAKRTLTNLYNARPSWLSNAHDDLDRAVLTAYGWPPGADDSAILEQLLELNISRQPA